MRSPALRAACRGARPRTASSVRTTGGGRRTAAPSRPRSRPFARPAHRGVRRPSDDPAAPSCRPRPRLAGPVLHFDQIGRARQVLRAEPFRARGRSAVPLAAGAEWCSHRPDWVDRRHRSSATPRRAGCLSALRGSLLADSGRRDVRKLSPVGTAFEDRDALTPTGWSPESVDPDRCSRRCRRARDGARAERRPGKAAGAQRDPGAAQGRVAQERRRSPGSLSVRVAAAARGAWRRWS